MARGTYNRRKVGVDGLPLEHYEQQVVVAYCQRKGIPVAAIPNGQKRTRWEQIEAKQSGLSSGFPDLIIPLMRHGHGALFIEMKTKSGGKVSPNQTYWLTLLTQNNYRAIVAKGADEAIREIDRYLAG